MCIRDRYKAFLKNKYDLCVFDVMMPKKDGFTLAQEVRAANAEIPIICLLYTSNSVFATGGRKSIVPGWTTD